MREQLINDLLVAKLTPEELVQQQRIADLLRAEPRCFYRDCFDPGHITGSAILVSEDGGRVLLNLHKIHGKWMSFGGHADGQEDIEAVTRREIEEECGITNIRRVGKGFFDVDVHPIPENFKKGEPVHAHYDIRFLYTTPETKFSISEESTDIQWFTFSEALELPIDMSTRRLLLKAKLLLQHD